MAVAPSSPGTPAREAATIEPTLERVRELARTHNLIPLSHSYVEDCETGVSQSST